MTHAFVTLALPFDLQKADAVDALLESMIPELHGKGKIRDALRDRGVHFLTITVVRGEGPEPTHLVMEFSADGDDAAAIATVGTALATWIKQIFAAAGIAADDDLPRQLSRNQIKTGQGLFETPGLNFTGHPGMTAERIRAEHKLARDIRTYFDLHPANGTPLQVLGEVRSRIAANPELSKLLEALSVPRLSLAGETNVGFYLGLAARGIVKFFWPVAAVLFIASTAIAISQHHFFSGVMVFLFSLLVSIFILIGVLAFVYSRLRAAEAANQPDDSLPNSERLDTVMAHESQTTQNHLAGISRMQPGWVRYFSLRIAFWVIGQMAEKIYKPGYLAEIGTIHFARWVLLPKTNKLLFFSNYGGSWESYLEDFITKAANGLTGAWSNTIGFPKSKNLFQDGATDGDRFKRWARRQQQPTRFWYSAYPHLTTARVRTNAAIRQGLATASTSDEASAWLSLFGSAPPPASIIETREVQSLLFGGFSNHPHAACLIIQLPMETDAARTWLGHMHASLSFGDDPPAPYVRILCLSRSGLAKLNLPEPTLHHFPMAFRQGMAHPTRAGILSDTGNDRPQKWEWGNDGTDCTVLIYAQSKKLLVAQQKEISKSLERFGGKAVHVIALADTEDKRDAMGKRKSSVEAFGFADGISQPIIRGTRRFLRATDSIHVVEPGEFLLGYPNNRGDVAPSITVTATADPANLLPVANPAHTGALAPDFNISGANAARDFARNGSFLVIRQLDQKTDVFDDFTKRTAKAFASHVGMPKHLDTAEKRQHWIAAKMVGRWKDGTSLIKYPHRPGTGWDGNDIAYPDNDFLPGTEDPSGQRCPYGAHIRRANPRDSLVPGSTEQLTISNRHRILRVGRSYSADGSGIAGSKNPGLLFMCFNSDIERQFEFIQQTWSMAWQFHGLENEVDPILARGVQNLASDTRKLARLTIPTPEGALQVKEVADFIDVRGGGYFFMPSRSALAYLSQSHQKSTQDKIS
jgi:deferrochelatase/peroxidase EfeB